MTVDPSGLMRSRVGSGGLDRLRWRELRGRGAGVVREVAGAAEQGMLPFLPLTADARLRTRVSSMTRSWRACEQLVLLGDAGAVDGACLLVDDETSRQVQRVADPSDLHRTSMAGRGLIVLGAAPWVVAARQRMAAEAERTWQIDDDGAGRKTPTLGGVRKMKVAGGADPRFVACSPVALSLAVLSGVSAGELVAAVQGLAPSLLSVDRSQNPALLIAQAAAGLMEGPGRTNPIWVAPRSAMPVVRHAARLWEAFVCRPTDGRGQSGVLSGRPVVVARGDEVAAQSVLRSGSDHWVLQFASGGGLSQQLDRAWSVACAEAGVPILQVRGVGPSSAERLSLLAVMTQAALLTGLHVGVEPLLMAGADRLREVQRSQGLDSLPS